MNILSRILYLLLGFLGSLLVFSLSFPNAQHFTILDVWRFFVSPGIISLIAATIGARAGARSMLAVTEDDLTRTYLSLLDLAAEDLRANLRILAGVRGRIEAVHRLGRGTVSYELRPETVHTLFLEDIEYPKLRRIVPHECTGDIFNLRNMKYVFDRWNEIVRKYYNRDTPLVRDEGEEEIVRHLSEDNHDNFITACQTALVSIDRLLTVLRQQKRHRRHASSSIAS